MINPPSLLAPLRYRRASKSDYEKYCIQFANELAVTGHQVARDAFLQGASEFEINQMYLQTIQQHENEIPYGNIVALNEHAAVLHFQNPRKQAPSHRRSFLIDAGASFYGYAADITRTYSYHDDEFAQLISTMDALQQALISQIEINLSFVDLAESMHQKLAKVLHQFNICNVSENSAYELGLTHTFLPHGLGHLLGLQVHDAGGHMTNAHGDLCLPPESMPFLRLTRTLQTGFIFTIEPGLYFIPLLLAELKSSEKARYINWSKVERLMPYGGIRIEDNIYLSSTDTTNLTRKAFSASN